MGIISSELPGIGTKYELDAESGDKISMVYMEKGGVQLYVSSKEGPDSASAVMNSTEARRIGNVLAGAALQVTEEEVCVVFSSLSDLSFKVHTYRLGDKTAGKTLSDLQVRSKTGSTVVAVSRGGKSRINPPADLRFEKDDSVLVIGDSEQLERFEEEYIRP